MFEHSKYIARNKLLNGYQLSKLYTFEVAARHESFALAAEELSISPSAVSHRINQLEEELGFKLFQRFHRRIALTPEGERVFWALKSSLSYLNQEILEIKSQELSGTLTVYSRPSIAQCWLVPKLADFAKQYPAISLNILTGNEMVNFNGAGIDLAIYFDDKPPETLSCQHLMNESMIPVCSPEYAKQHDLVGKPFNLRQSTLLHDRQAWSYDSNESEWHSWARNFNVDIAEDQRSMGFDRSDLAVIAAMNHVGIAMGRKNLVNKRLESQELIAPFPEFEMQCEQRYYISTLSERQWPKINAFIQWLKTMAGNTEG
ncbi:MAG: DNA-binding transcriptional regulator DsdC [Enterobacterales bacterium]|uniref:DNA-binding transcriptional regulator DsdC n=1 Tax=Obesumbacterium proteus TaxID=82983 RepID=UPI001033C09E|nr:DNA-binding transcriptional regulator DsdC [Obesumbacterium proteus]MDN5450212.1 DNA-binding transcriptional regulator DsdC [Enterobacterales bacterium]MDN5986646.1 DNA-binding transcriptional regulator DsdC [Hafniaceae bacterium]MDN5969057.1 DNA-binding transcriptional regulator DsdC [Enterobacterales bacterium]MDN6018930.1 DNA-binding transcriptional regulator DsdC [Enterobacterales bacterium]MDN6115760.1 DNA-binding transcriptional regulator DsdC [Enterobacterales bacterium]